jgi:hypothetical protein
VQNPLRIIRAPADLAAYRATELAPARVRAYVRAARGPVLLTHDTGVGKSRLLDGLVEEHRRDPEAGLLIYATSQTSVVGERPWVREHLALPPAARAAHDVAVLIGRPRKRCGDLDLAWQEYERAGCGALGRAELCGRCPRRARCPWPEQRTPETLAGKRVVAATQANLAATPALVAELKAKTGAARVEIVLDEATVLEARFRREISHETLRASRAVFARAGAPEPWLATHDALLDPTYDVACVAAPVRLTPDLALAVQREGLARGGPAFRNLVYELPSVPCGAPVRMPRGIEYLARPWLRGHPCLIAAAGLPLDLARHRLGTDAIEEYSPGVRVLHEYPTTGELKGWSLAIIRGAEGPAWFRGRRAA